MSLITQCPACATMFRVVPDQLRISEGWVRCGQCDEVFDANAHMLSLEAATEIPATLMPTSDAVAQPDATPDPLDPASSSRGDYDWGAIVEPHVQESGRVAEPIAVDVQVGTQFASEEQAPAELDVATQEHAELEPYLEPSHLDLPVMEDAMAAHFAPPPENNWQHAPEPPVESFDRSPSTAEEEAPLSFMPRTQQASRWGHVLGNRMMAVVSCVLALVLGGQILYMERDRVAATYPVTRPLLLAACEVLRCTVSAPKQIESIAIDSSAFTSIKPGVYLLHVTLKNGAALALASPALELTLTDMQDRPLLRRVVLAQEFAGKTQVIEAGAELSSSIPVTVRAGSAIENIAGYKLLAFYP